MKVHYAQGVPPSPLRAGSHTYLRQFVLNACTCGRNAPVNSLKLGFAETSEQRRTKLTFIQTGNQLRTYSARPQPHPGRRSRAGVPPQPLHRRRGQTPHHEGQWPASAAGSSLASCLFQREGQVQHPPALLPGSETQPERTGSRRDNRLPQPMPGAPGGPATDVNALGGTRQTPREADPRVRIIYSPSPDGTPAPLSSN
ncbi:WAS/WASL-interacting protein family member 2-like [Sorex araneus]|uniref:WAS/WASL-interacting protein family member 2-like n=1 Tax=Sorex araneus TaxID=42254 RepID=UPI002433864A|nr:WAS/WASL-interacting protein family member 2-like [Sorex araneus]